MDFIKNVEKKEYEAFAKGYKEKSHFLQSYAWGSFQEKANNRKAHYLGVKDSKGNLIATALLLEKKLYFGYSYFYSPRGFVMDFSNLKLLKFFTENLKNYVKTKKGIFLKLDPDIVIKKTNSLGEEINLDYDWKNIYDYILKLNYKHLGFTQEFELSQPRFTYRIDLSQGKEKVLNKFNKTTQIRINLSKNFQTKVVVSDIKDLDKFYELMKETESRKDFTSYDYNYYENLFKIYNKDHDIKLFLGYFYPKKALKYYKERIIKLDQEINDLENKQKAYKHGKITELRNQINQAEEKSEKLKIASQRYGEEILLNAHIIIFHNNKAWALYAGNKDELQEMGTNFHTYEEHILDALKNNYQIYDHFGAPGPKSKDKILEGLSIMKRSFGGDYIEFIGEFDLITNKLMYFIFNHTINFYRKIKRLFKKIKNK